MIEIVSQKDFTVPFRVTEVGAAAGKIICMGYHGQFGVFDPLEGKLRQFQFEVPKPFKSAAVCPVTGMVACLQEFGMNLLRPFDYSWEYCRGRFESCCFCTDGSMWTASKQDSEVILIEKRNSAGDVLASVEVDTPYHGAILLYTHPVSGCVLYSSGGQEGQAVIWIADKDDQLETLDVIDSDFVSFDFDVNNERIVVADLQGLTFFSLEDGEEVDSLPWPEEDEDECEDEDENEEMAVTNLVLVSDRFAVLELWDEQRKLLADIQQMEICGEVGLPGTIYRLHGNKDYPFCSVERLDSGSPSINLGNKIRLWNWNDDWAVS